MKDDYQDWVGRSESTTDILDAKQARLLQATLDQEPSLNEGDALPPLWHWIYFLPNARHSQLGRDGHPTKGGFLPPVPLPRRMWAGGAVVFTKPILLGETITKTSTIKSVVNKEGRSGPLCFVTVEHQLADASGAVYLTETQDIVYREDPAPDAPKPSPAPAPGSSVDSTTIEPTSVQLFRYSALTFNGHRIHYDVDYCRDVEGYPGLVFHGPLSATLLAQFAQAKGGGKDLAEFRFRAVAPVFDTAPFTLHTDGQNQFWSQTPEGHLSMKADVSFR